MRSHLQSKEGTAKHPRDTHPTPQNGTISLLQSRTSKCNVGPILAAKISLGDACWDAGLQGLAFREGCRRELPAAWLCRAGDVKRGAGQTFAKLFDQKGL